MESPGVVETVVDDPFREFWREAHMAMAAGLITRADVDKIRREGSRKSWAYGTHLRGLRGLIEDRKHPKRLAWEIEAEGYGIKSLDAWSLFCYLSENPGAKVSRLRKRFPRGLEPGLEELLSLGLARARRNEHRLAEVTLVKFRNNGRPADGPAGSVVAESEDGT